MNKIFVLSKNYFSFFLIALFILAINYSLLKMNNLIEFGAFLITAILIVAYWITFAKNSIYPIILFFIPLSFELKIGGGVAFDFPGEFLVGLLALIYLTRAFRKPTVDKNVLTHPITILLFTELVWMIISSMTSNMPLVSAKRCFVRFVFLIVFYLIAYHWFSNPQKRKWFFLFYALGLIIPFLHTIYCHAFYGFDKEAAYAMPQPFYADHTIYGAVLAFVFPALLILFYNRKIFSISGANVFYLFVLILLILTGEIFSFSRAAWISLVIAFLFYFLVKIHVRTWMLIAGLFILGSTLFIFRQELIESVKRNEAVSSKGSLVEHVESVTNLQTDASNLERLNRWTCAIRMGEERPILGFGPGMYQFEYGRFQVRSEMTYISTFRGNRGHAHSEFFNALSETGFPGLGITIVIMFTIINYGLKVIYKATNRQDKTLALAALLGLITFYVHGFFNAFMDSDKMVVLVFGSVAMLVCMDVEQRKKEKLKRQNANLEPIDIQ